MDESTLEIKKYVDQLPPVIKTAVLGNEWHKRVGEIGQKYNLHLDQISSLEYEVMFVMIGMEPEEDLVSNIQKELNISEILATQIAEDVNVRVFQYILKLMQDKTAPKADQFEKTESTASTPIATPSSPLLSEIESMADKMPPDAHHAKEVPPPANLPGMEEVVEEKKLSDEVSFRAEMIPKPIPDIPPTMANTKLNSVVKSEVIPTVKQNVPAQTENPIVKSYSADPYREPLE